MPLTIDCIQYLNGHYAPWKKCGRSPAALWSTQLGDEPQTSSHGRPQQLSAAFLYPGRWRCRREQHASSGSLDWSPRWIWTGSFHGGMACCRPHQTDLWEEKHNVSWSKLKQRIPAFNLDFQVSRIYYRIYSLLYHECKFFLKIIKMADKTRIQYWTHSNPCNFSYH